MKAHCWGLARGLALVGEAEAQPRGADDHAALIAGDRMMDIEAEVAGET